MFLLRLIWAVVRALPAKRADLVAENLALRQQLIVLHRRNKRPRLKTKDRMFWLWLARSWSGWRDSLLVVKPETVVRWHRQVPDDDRQVHDPPLETTESELAGVPR